MRSTPGKQLSQRWTPSQARRCVVLAASSPPPMRSFDSPIPSSNGSSSSTSATTSAAAPSAAAAAPASPGDASYRSYRVSPWAAMKFNGPVPERVNGRLAMLAFLHIAQHEAETGQTGVSGPALAPCGHGGRATAALAAAASTWQAFCLMLLWTITDRCTACLPLSPLPLAAAAPPSSRHPLHALILPPPRPPAVLQQALGLPYNYAAWPLVVLMLLMVYATFPPALAGAREEDFGIFSVVRQWGLALPALTGTPAGGKRPAGPPLKEGCSSACGPEGQADGQVKQASRVWSCLGACHGIQRPAPPARADLSTCRLENGVIHLAAFLLPLQAAEKTNGRAAMLGLAVLAALEWHSGFAFF